MTLIQMELRYAIMCSSADGKHETYFERYLRIMGAKQSVNSSLGLKSVLDELSVSPSKVALFENDISFRAGWAAWSYGAHHEAMRTAKNSALLIMKPELLASGRGTVVLEALTGSGFVILDYYWVTMSRSMATELWRYVWNSATVERIYLAVLMALTGPSLVLLLRDTRAEDTYPGSLRLTALKGSALAARRTPGQLRSLIPTRNPMIGHIHTADEPADIVREIAILFDWKKLCRIVATYRSTTPNDRFGDLLEELEPWTAFSPVGWLNPELAWNKIREALLVPRMETDGLPPQHLVNRVEDIRRRGGSLTWHEVSTLLQYATPAFKWDAMMVAADSITLEVPGREQQIKTTAINSLLELWHARVRL
jgi:hypothetical protein